MIDKIYDHYKETCSLCRELNKERDSYFIKMLIALIGIFLLSMQTNEILMLLISYVQETYKCSITFSADIISIFVWLLLLYFTLGYYRKNISLERLYKYIYNLETAINSLMQNNTFHITREGKSYLNNYTKLIDLVDVVYKIVIPIIYIILVFIMIIKILITGIGILTFAQIGIGFICVGLTFVYMTEVKK